MISRKSIPVISAGNMAVTITSPYIDVQNMVLGSIQASFTGAPTGTIKLQCSNIPSIYQTHQPLSDQIPTPTEVWTDVANSQAAISAAGNVMWNIADIGYEKLRVVYTATSGTGSLTVVMVGKG